MRRKCGNESKQGESRSQLNKEMGCCNKIPHYFTKADQILRAL